MCEDEAETENMHQTLSEIVRLEQSNQELNEMLGRLNAQQLCHKYHCLVAGGLSETKAFVYILHHGTDIR